MVDNVILTVDAKGQRSWIQAAGEITNLEDSAGNAYFGNWPISVNYGKGDEIIGPGTVGWLRQDGYLAGYKVFDGYIHEDGGVMWADGWTVVFPRHLWIPTDRIQAGPFGEYPGAVSNGSSLRPETVERILRRLSVWHRQDLDRKVESYRRMR